MALPTTISNVTSSATLLTPPRPFISSGGNVYVVVVDSADNSIIEVHKATDPTSSFTEQNSAGKPDLTNVASCLAVFPVGDVLHIASQESTTGRVGYHTFNMATDLWAIVNETVTTSPGAVANSVGIAVRSDGDVIILYAGAFETVTMTNFRRVQYARRESASWTVDVAVDNGGSVNWFGSASAILGSSDRVHFGFCDDTNSDAYQRCLRSDNSLETFPSAFDTAISSNANVFDIGLGVAYDVAGTMKVRMPYCDLSDILAVAVFDSADTPSLSTSTGISDAAILRGRSMVCANKGSTLYALWIRNADSDGLYDANVNEGGWGTDTVGTAGTLTAISANVYVRAGNYKLAYVMRDGGAYKYNEVDLGAAPSLKWLTMSQAVTRAATY